MSNRETNLKNSEFKTCDDEAYIEIDDNELEGRSITGYFTIDVFFRLFKKNLRNQNEF